MPKFTQATKPGAVAWAVIWPVKPLGMDVKLLTDPVLAPCGMNGGTWVVKGIPASCGRLSMSPKKKPVTGVVSGLFTVGLGPTGGPW